MPWWSGRRGGARLVVPVTALLLLAGCTGETPAAPETSPPPPVVTPSPTPTPTPTESAAVDVTVKPERPAALDEPPSVEGAVAVAEYFLLLYPYVNATGDLSDWNLLRHPECIFCSDVVATVESKVAAGQHDEGGLVAITNRTGTEVNPGYWYSAAFDLMQEPSVTVDASGVVVEEFPNGTEVRADLAVTWESGRWSIRETTATEKL